MSYLLDRFRKLKWSPSDIAIGLFLVMILIITLPFALIVWLLFQVKCVIFWKQRTAFRSLSEIASRRLELLKHETNEALTKEKTNFQVTWHWINGRKGSICPFVMKNTDSVDVVVQVSLRYFQFIQNPCEKSALGFRILSDGRRNDLSAEEIGA